MDHLIWHSSWDKYHIQDLSSHEYYHVVCRGTSVWLSVEDKYHFVFLWNISIHIRYGISTIYCMTLCHGHTYSVCRQETFSFEISPSIPRRGNISFDIRRVNMYLGTSRNIRTTLCWGQVLLRHLIRHSPCSSILYTTFCMSMYYSLWNITYLVWQGRSVWLSVEDYLWNRRNIYLTFVRDKY